MSNQREVQYSSLQTVPIGLAILLSPVTTTFSIKKNKTLNFRCFKLILFNNQDRKFIKRIHMVPHVKENITKLHISYLQDGKFTEILEKYHILENVCKKTGTLIWTLVNSVSFFLLRDILKVGGSLLKEFSSLKKRKRKNFKQKNLLNMNNQFSVRILIWNLFKILSIKIFMNNNCLGCPLPFSVEKKLLFT